MKASRLASIILHHKFPLMPPTVEIEVAPMLRIDREVSGIEKANFHLIAIGIQVCAINVAAEV
jgi:hypothetical protein